MHITLSEELKIVSSFMESKLNINFLHDQASFIEFQDA